MTKFYFSHFGNLMSLNEQDAKKIAQDAIRDGFHSFNTKYYPSLKVIKFRDLNRNSPTIKYGKKYIDVNHCLDWSREDWSYFLKGIQ